MSEQPHVLDHHRETAREIAQLAWPSKTGSHHWPGGAFESMVDKFAAIIACSEAAEIDAEQARWQERIYAICKEHYPMVDGAGCDSGDPLDVTAAEVRMTINHLLDNESQKKSCPHRSRANPMTLTELIAACRAECDEETEWSEACVEVSIPDMRRLLDAIDTLLAAQGCCQHKVFIGDDNCPHCEPDCHVCAAERLVAK